MKIHNIKYSYDGEIVGKAIETEEGFSISINGRDVGVYKTFESWNLNSGNSYYLSEVKDSEYEDWADMELIDPPLTDFEKQLNEYVKVDVNSFGYIDPSWVVASESFTSLSGDTYFLSLKFKKIKEVKVNGHTYPLSNVSYNKDRSFLIFDKPLLDNTHISVFGFIENGLNKEPKVLATSSDEETTFKIDGETYFNGANWTYEYRKDPLHLVSNQSVIQGNCETYILPEKAKTGDRIKIINNLCDFSVLDTYYCKKLEIHSNDKYHCNVTFLFYGTSWVLL